MSISNWEGRFPEHIRLAGIVVHNLIYDIAVDYKEHKPGQPDVEKCVVALEFQIVSW
jgi:hypothetical protein